MLIINYQTVASIYLNLLRRRTMAEKRKNSLHNHITSVKKGERVFENAFQGVSRMVLEGDIDKVVVNGKSTFDS